MKLKFAEDIYNFISDASLSFAHKIILAEYFTPLKLIVGN